MASRARWSMVADEKQRRAASVQRPVNGLASCDVVLSEFERQAGFREFALRAAYRVIVFRGPGQWWLHHLDQGGRTVNRHLLLSFDDVAAHLREQPTALDGARRLERVASAPTRSCS
jgi:hypothetical protein